jgi:hemolysin activation/secretion protein
MKKIITILLLSLFPLSAHAYSEAEQQSIINQQNQVIQNQKQIERAKEIQIDLKQIDKEQKRIEEQEKDYLEKNDGKMVHDLRAIQCFRIQTISFLENKILSKFQERSLSKNYLGRCLTLDQILEFNKEVSNYLIAKGFITSRAEVPAQNLSSGDLQVNIIESYLENITLNDDKFFDQTQKLSAFGLIGITKKDNRILNLQEIELGIDQMNRISSNNAAVKLLPGTVDNSSIVTVENHPKNTSRVNVSYDNIGSSITGEKRDTIGFTHDNLLHLNDSFNISRTANDSDSYNKHRSTSTSGNFSMPLGRHTFTFSASKSSYFFLTGENKNIRTYGDTLTKTASLDSVLIKNKKFKISSNFNISSRYNQNFQNDEKIEVSSRKASIGTIGLSNTFFLNSASLFLKPSYSKALNILDAKKDAKNLPSKAAHAEFNIFKFYGNYGKKLTIPYLKTPASYSFNIDSQISQQKLNGIDQFSSGGFYSVRGFRNSSISGDSGYNIRNEFSANLGQLILPQFNSEKISKNLSYLNYFSLTPFYDYGFVRMKGGLQSGRLSGTGAKISFNKNNINASFTFSKATSKSMLLLQNRNEGSIIYFDIGAELGFF